MKVSLIYSRINTSIQTPLGLLWIGAVLRKNGHAVQVIDPIPGRGNFIDKVKGFDPDLVGISIMTTEYPKAKEIINSLKGVLKNTLYCAGGIHPTALPRQTIEELGLDFVVMGEGEYIMRDICYRLENDRSYRDIAGIGYKKNGNYVENPRYPLITDLDKLSMPARDLLDMEWYLTPPGLVRGAFLKRTLGLLATRGCPYQCIYCGSHTIFGRSIRRRSVHNILEEVEHLINTYNIDGFYFYDDTFTVDRNYVSEFCQGLKKRGINLKWGCQIRANTVWKSLSEEMRDAGCIQVDIGVESGSDKVLKNLKKGTTVAVIKDAFKTVKKAGIRTMATFIVGSPGETSEDIKMTRRLAKEISPDYTKFFYLTPFPGSELYGDALENSWLDRNIGFSEAWQIRQVDNPIMAINFSREELRKIRADLQNSFFFKNHLSLLRDNWQFSILILGVLLRHPIKAIKEIFRVFKTGRIDYMLESLLEWYRVDKAAALKKPQTP